MNLEFKENFNFSYWEKQVWPKELDVVVVGSGIVGIHAAMELRRERPNWKIAILEKGLFSQGASTKNAGFACFGSPSELLDDIDKSGYERCSELLRSRYQGAVHIKNDFKDIDFGLTWHGGYECFRMVDAHLYDRVISRLDEINSLVQDATGISKQFAEVEVRSPLKNFISCIKGKFEGSLHPVQWIDGIQKLCVELNIQIWKGVEVIEVESKGLMLYLTTNHGTITTGKVIFATNAYPQKGLISNGVVSAKNQVYVSNHMGCKMTGTYHVDRGFIYFKAVDGRLLIGGARNHDNSKEYSFKIEEYLLNFVLKHIDVPKNFRFEHKWIGMIGIGESKSPIIEKVKPGLWRAVRLGGMGVALGAQVGREVAQRCINE